MARCLIIDDNRDSREGVAEYLQAFGFEVEVAADGEQGLALMRRHLPDVLILDLQMRGLDGWELISQIRAEPNLADLPVIVISACVFPEDQARATAAGCDLFLTKPCAPGEMLRAVRSLLPAGARNMARHGKSG
jgi:CheY-like chemotaxis protein